MGRPRKIKSYEIPENVLNMLTEHTGGGYFLMCFDNLQNFRIYSNFDSELHFKALKSDAIKWLHQIENIENQQILISLMPNNNK